jgi:hypothetical protein
MKKYFFIFEKAGCAVTVLAQIWLITLFVLWRANVMPHAPITISIVINAVCCGFFPAGFIIAKETGLIDREYGHNALGRSLALTVSWMALCIAGIIEAFLAVHTNTSAPDHIATVCFALLAVVMIAKAVHFFFFLPHMQTNKGYL